MKCLKIILIAVSMLYFISSAYPADKGGFQFRREPELQQIRPKKPVMIKLKRTAKDKYTWELKGDDPDEIIKIDKKFRKMLSIK